MSKSTAVLVVSAVFVFSCGAPMNGPDGGSGGGGGLATGGGNGSGGGTGGGATGGGGGATGGGGGGSQCSAQQVNVTVSPTCSALPSPGACGGALSGRYCYTAFCIDEARLLLPLQRACTGAGGAIAFTNTAGTVNGSVDFIAGNVTRSATLTITGTASVPAMCAPTGCSMVQQAFGAAGATATCTSSGGGCSCNYTAVVPTAASRAFTTSGGVLTVGANTYEYCAGADLKYRETTMDGAEPGVATLTR